MSNYDYEEEERDQQIAELQAENARLRAQLPQPPPPPSPAVEALDAIPEDDPEYVNRVMETVAQHGGNTTWTQQ